jgi:hypothetical protein
VVTGGVDTHKDTHTAAVLDATGRLLGHQQFPTTPAGYGLLLAWLRSHGELDKVGIEGTGAYGAGLALHLRVAGVELVEVDRPDRKARRQQGKSDPVDAEAAARAAQAGRATGIPKDRVGSGRCGRGPARATGRPPQRRGRPCPGPDPDEVVDRHRARPAAQPAARAGRAPARGALRCAAPRS